MKQMKNNILKIAFAVIVLVSTKSLFGQQEPQYSQYMFNMMSINPAYTGTQEALNALMISRWQWVGLKGAPRSHTFALHSPIKEKRIGVGLSVIADNIGPVSNTYINLNYSHRFNITEEIKISLGLKGGIYNYSLGLSDLALNEEDNSFSEDFRKSFQPNLGSGAYMYTDKYYVGISIPKLVKTKLEEGESTTDISSELKRHFFITGGYIFDIHEDWKIKPSVLGKMVEGAPPSLDVTAQAFYKNKIWLGTTYRVGDALAFLFEIQATRQLIVGYSFDYTLSDMSNVSSGTHEILISFDFAGFSNDKVKSPRYF
jgi:type IX secretion system PorP/SprF family membrane protein